MNKINEILLNEPISINYQSQASNEAVNECIIKKYGFKLNNILILYLKSRSSCIFSPCIFNLI